MVIQRTEWWFSRRGESSGGKRRSSSPALAKERRQYPLARQACERKTVVRFRRGTVPIAFGKYQLQRKLAEGGMAEVFLGRQAGMEGFEKLIVVKRIRPELSSDPNFVNMFLNEARVAA